MHTWTEYHYNKSNAVFIARVVQQCNVMTVSGTKSCLFMKYVFALIRKNIFFAIHHLEIYVFILFSGIAVWASVLWQLEWGE